MKIKKENIVEYSPEILIALLGSIAIGVSGVALAHYMKEDREARLNNEEEFTVVKHLEDGQNIYAEPTTKYSIPLDAPSGGEFIQNGDKVEYHVYDATSNEYKVYPVDIIYTAPSGYTLNR